VVEGSIEEKMLKVRLSSTPWYHPTIYKTTMLTPACIIGARPQEIPRFFAGHDERRREEDAAHRGYQRVAQLVSGTFARSGNQQYGQWNWMGLW
jgi:hypothetical protein